MSVVGAPLPQARGTPTGIHIGRTPRIRKGFVIALADRRSPAGHEKWVFATTVAPAASPFPSLAHSQTPILRGFRATGAGRAVARDRAHRRSRPARAGRDLFRGGRGRARVRLRRIGY